MTVRILAVDPGEKNIGIAISDPSGTIASPLCVVKHTSMAKDCAEIVRLATDNLAVKIIIGLPVGEDEEETPQMRHAQKLAETLSSQTSLPVDLFDESGSTQIARRTRIDMGVSRKKRSGHLDELAAVVILQSYLDQGKKHDQ